MVPRSVATSEAFKTAPNVCVRILIALLMQPAHVRRNGSGFVARATAREFGIRSQGDLLDGLRELEARGLIVQTRPGARPPMRRAALWAVTWLPIADPDPKDPHEAAPESWASDAYKKWTPPLVMGRTGWTVRDKREALAPKRGSAGRTRRAISKVRAADIDGSAAQTGELAYGSAGRTLSPGNMGLRVGHHIDISPRVEEGQECAQ